MKDAQTLATSEEMVTSRRDAIKLGLAALAGVGISALAPASAYATDHVAINQGEDTSGTLATTLRSTTSSGATLRLFNESTGTGTSQGALWAYTDVGQGSAVYANHGGAGFAVDAAQFGTGVGLRARIMDEDNGSDALQAYTPGAGSGVYGYSTSTWPNTRGVKGELTSANARGCAIEGKVNAGNLATGIWAQASGAATALRSSAKGTGPAVEATIDAAANASTCVSATTAGTGGAVVAKVTNAASAAAAVAAETAGTGAAVSAKVTNAASAAAAVAAETAGPGAAVTGAATGAGVGVKASSVGGAALQVNGVLALSRAGKKRISKGKKSGTVTVASGVASSAMILCTSQGTTGGGVRYAKRTSATTFKIYMNSTAKASVYVAWMIVG